MLMARILLGGDVQIISQDGTRILCEWHPGSASTVYWHAATDEEKQFVRTHMRHANITFPEL